MEKKSNCECHCGCGIALYVSERQEPFICSDCVPHCEGRESVRSRTNS